MLSSRFIKIDESELLYKIDDNTTPFTGVIVDENKEEEYEFLGRLKNGKKMDLGLDGMKVKKFLK